MTKLKDEIRDTVMEYFEILDSSGTVVGYHNIGKDRELLVEEITDVIKNFVFKVIE